MFAGTEGRGQSSTSLPGRRIQGREGTATGSRPGRRLACRTLKALCTRPPAVTRGQPPTRPAQRPRPAGADVGAPPRSAPSGSWGGAGHAGRRGGQPALSRRRAAQGPLSLVLQREVHLPIYQATACPRSHWLFTSLLHLYCRWTCFYKTVGG